MTFDDQFLPPGEVLVKRPAQDFVRSLRKRSGRKIRYVLVGEYGETNPVTLRKDGGIYRPHYHAAIFGIADPQLIQDAWGKGFTETRGLGVESARYIVSYLLKRQNTEDRCHGKPPEFKLQSTHPGIGLGAALRLRLPAGRVPSGIRIGGSIYPLGQYLSNALRLRQGEPVEDKIIRELTLKTVVRDRDPKTHKDRIENAKRSTQATKNRNREKPGL